MKHHFAWCFVFLTTAAPLGAQWRTTAGIAPVVTTQARPECRDVATCARPNTGQVIDSRISPWAIAASAVLPGTGQAMLGVNRGLPYVAIEALAWTAYVKASRDYRRRRDDYRNLAANVARAPFTPIRPNGDFAYYERMSHYPESGRYATVVDGVPLPESDTTTWNGATWLLARRTFWSDPDTPPDMSSPEWERALAFYRKRAYDELYLWSWSGAPREFALFRDLIGESNDANRRAMLHLGVIIANHVLSTVDAFITVRLRTQDRGSSFAVEGSIPFLLHR